ncbi:hypothetical protein D3C71_2007660 [compost metagenome]
MVLAATPSATPTSTNALARRDLRCPCFAIEVTDIKQKNGSDRLAFGRARRLCGGSDGLRPPAPVHAMETPR